MSAILFLNTCIGVLLPLYSAVLVSEGGELRIIGRNGAHACLGSTLTLECIVNGGESDSTVWQGTAFDDCNIILLHLRFRQEGGNSKECSNGAIAVRNMSNEGSLYISQLEVAINPPVVGKDIVCAHDNGTASNVIGHHQINIVSSWQAHIQLQLDTESTATSTSSQLPFSWRPAISDCPTVDIHYYILSANCGNCPFATADTSVICTNAPPCGLCTLAVQTTVSDYAVKDLLSDPVYVFLNRTRNCVQSGSNNSEINTGSDMSSVSNIKIGFTVFVAAIVSTAVLATALTLCLTVTIAALLVKKRARSLKLLQKTDSERHRAEKRLYEPVIHNLTSASMTLEQNEAYGTNSSANVCKQ